MLAAFGFIVLEIAAMGAWAMVAKPFWLDEVSTWLVAGTGSLPESIQALPPERTPTRQRVSCSIAWERWSPEGCPRSRLALSQ